MKNRRLKHFEHGAAFMTLESVEGVYIVTLYINDKVVNTFSTTTLECALEMYHLTCKETIKRSGQDG